MTTPTVTEDLLARARNLERYPFESATMAEAGRLAAEQLREVAAAMHSRAVGDERVERLQDALDWAEDYDPLLIGKIRERAALSPVSGGGGGE
jgi:hypothetical protein